MTSIGSRMGVIVETPNPGMRELRDLCSHMTLRKYRTIRASGWQVDLPSDAPANAAGLPEVSQGICRMRMEEKAPPDVPRVCAVFFLSTLIRLCDAFSGDRRAPARSG